MIAGACGDEVRNRHVDEGTLCLAASETGPRPDTVKVGADEAIRISVQLPACLSSSCDVDRQFACGVKLEGDQLTISSLHAWTSQGRSCTADCGSAIAFCDTPRLPAGTYTLKFGDQTQTLQIPSTLGKCDAAF